MASTSAIVLTGFERTMSGSSIECSPCASVGSVYKPSPMLSSTVAYSSSSSARSGCVSCIACTRIFLRRQCRPRRAKTSEFCNEAATCLPGPPCFTIGNV
eukprot:2920062-Prymnesium_polylepis.1